MPRPKDGELIWTPNTPRGCGATTRNNSTTKPGTTGDSPGFSTFSTTGARQGSDERQHDSCGPNPIRGRGDSVAYPLSADGLSSHLGRQSEYQIDSQTHTRTPKCRCRSSVTTASNQPREVESFSTSANSCVVPMGPTARRYLPHVRLPMYVSPLLDLEARKVDPLLLSLNTPLHGRTCFPNSH